MSDSTNQEGCNCKEEHIEGEDVTHLVRTRSADQEVEEARAALVIDVDTLPALSRHVGEAVNRAIDHLIEAVRRQERERVTHELENHRWAGGGDGCALCARSSEEAGNGSSVA